MSARIKILSESVINRIAAGEVIERPVSVVKELVENSIDAQASSVNVEIENGGRKLIRVRDNGTGMSHDDAFLALERHATSKLKSETDLVGIATMGFRGEALASIASISRLKLLTRDESDTAGTEVLIEGGVLRKSERMGMGIGTAVEVRNLFFNVPVRRKFLKGSGVEAAHIQELLIKLALAFPTVGFTYSEDGRSKMDAPAVRSTFERIHTLYSKDVRENLVAVEHNVGDARLQGYVARPPYARSNMRSVLTFVNGRSVRDPSGERGGNTVLFKPHGTRAVSAGHPVHRTPPQPGRCQCSSPKGRGTFCQPGANLTAHPRRYPSGIDGGSV